MSLVQRDRHGRPLPGAHARVVASAVCIGVFCLIAGLARVSPFLAVGLLFAAAVGFVVVRDSIRKKGK